MNIFVLNENPVDNSIMLCNKHTIKMLLESVQILCNCFDPTEVPYRSTHYNHPCCIWTRESLDNFEWLKTYALGLCREYTHRYKRVHKSEQVIHTLNQPELKSIGLTSFRLAMPDQYKCKDAVQSYKQYYLGEKLGFSKWPEHRMPEFIHDYCEQNNVDIKMFCS